MKMHRNVIILGLVSLFTDVSSEMLYPLMPLYVTAVLGASPAILGVIEGVAESLASLLKLFSGRVADRFARRKPLAILGYGLSAAAKVFFIVATTWTGILWGRVSDRFGKGIRTAPRDALIADASSADSRGKAFGLHRAMDTAGAVLGIGLAYWLFTSYNGDYQIVFLVALAPAFFGVALLFLVKEEGRSAAQKAKELAFSWGSLAPQLKYFLVISFLFNLGNSSNQFLLVRAGTLGFSASEVILLYLLMNISYFLLAYPAGALSDRLGRRRLLVSGYLLYGLVYIGFAVAESSWPVLGLFVVYGLYIGLTEGVEKALLADMAVEGQKATVYGLHALLVGVALLPASILAGLLWELFGVAAPFYFGGCLGLLAAVALWVALRGAEKRNGIEQESR